MAQADVAKIYEGITGHAPDVEGLQYWTGRQAAGEDIGTAIAGAITPENVAGWRSGAYTPYNAPLPEKPKQPEYKPYTPPKVTSTAEAMTGLLQKESPYLTAARQRGKEYAAGRGLLDSSIAAGAAERSAIEASLPIAQQDAAYSQNIGTIAAQEAASGRLSEQEAGQKLGLSEQEAAQRLDLSGVEANQALALERVQQEGANLRQQAELDVKTAMDTMQLGSQERTSLGSSIANMGQSFSEQIANINRDPNVDAAAKTAAIETLSNAYQANIESLMSVYGVQIDWEPLKNVTVAEPEPETETQIPERKETPSGGK